jgi:hypothetical protein
MMASTMDGIRSHEPLGLGDATLRQLRLLWSTRRPVLLAVALLSLLILIGPPFLDLGTTRLFVLWPVLVGLAGPAWAFAVFHEEGPTRRHYHWSQPAARHVQSLARIAAGAVWLMAVLALLLGAAVVLGALDGNAASLGELSALAWINVFTGPLIGYMGISVLTVSSDHPLRWLLLLWLSLLILALVGHWLGTDRLERVVGAVLGHPDWGLLSAIYRPIEVASARMVDASGAPVAGWTFSPGRWLAATALWLGLFTGLVAWLASLHPDRVPRLPRFR